MDDFDKGMLKEIEEIDEWITARRNALYRALSPLPNNQENFGRFFAIGAAQSAMWRIMRRIKGDDH